MMDIINKLVTIYKKYHFFYYINFIFYKYRFYFNKLYKLYFNFYF